MLGRSSAKKTSSKPTPQSRKRARDYFGPEEEGGEAASTSADVFEFTESPVNHSSRKVFRAAIARKPSDAIQLPSTKRRRVAASSQISYADKINQERSITDTSRGTSSRRKTKITVIDDDDSPLSERLARSPIQTPTKRPTTRGTGDAAGDDTEDDRPLSNRGSQTPSTIKIYTIPDRPHKETSIKAKGSDSAAETGKSSASTPMTLRRSARRKQAIEIVVESPTCRTAKVKKTASNSVASNAQGCTAEEGTAKNTPKRASTIQKRVPGHSAKQSKTRMERTPTKCIDTSPSTMTLLPSITVSREDLAKGRKAILFRLTERSDPVRLIGLEDQYNKIYDLLDRTVRQGESNSVLLVGNRGTGKTAVLRRVIAELHSKYSKDVGSPRDKESAPTKSFFEIRLSGLLQTDDRQALREIVRQLHLEQSMEALQLGSFADCLAFVLSTLRAGSIESTPVVFILEDIDLFAQHPKQALLYNLFDIAQSSQNPIAVIGFTRRIDFVYLLEKRVKSRFSHRQIYFYPPDSLAGFTEILQQAISLSDTDGIADEGFVDVFNEQVASLLKDACVINAVKGIFELSRDIRRVYNMFYPAVVRLTTEEPFISTTHLFPAKPPIDPRTQTIASLSILELILLIAMSHQEQRQVETFNFEMVYDEYREFIQRVNTFGRGAGNLWFVKGVAMKAFERLLSLELAKPVDGVGAKCPKEYRMVRLVIGLKEIEEGVRAYEGCPEAVVRWAVSR